ncbi:hypothetical protein [Microcoleus sp. F4-D5]
MSNGTRVEESIARFPKSRSHGEDTEKKRRLKPRLHETLPGWCAG